MSSPKTLINTPAAPAALAGIYNQAIVAAGLVFCSGTVALNSNTMKIIDGDISAHTVSRLPSFQ